MSLSTKLKNLSNVAGGINPAENSAVLVINSFDKQVCL
jgi:hypothetical protein